MRPNGWDDGRRERRLALQAGSGAQQAEGRDATGETDVVFDFTGLYGFTVPDLALILTARLQTGPEGRVWVRELPLDAWRILQGLGLDHLFLVYPGLGDDVN